MASGKIANFLKPINVALNYKNNWTNNGLSTLTVSGNVCTLNFTFRNGTNQPYTTIAKFDSAYAPIAGFYPNAAIGDSNRSIYITTGGEIQVLNTLPATNSGVCSCSWCCDRYS